MAKRKNPGTQYINGKFKYKCGNEMRERKVKQNEMKSLSLDKTAYE